MKNKSKYFKITISIIFAIIIFWIAFSFPNHVRNTLSAMKNAGIQLASVILSHNFRTIAEIKSNYNDVKQKVRILIVPGHEPNYGGAEFGTLKERDMNVELGQNLELFLEDNGHYEVFTSRDYEAWHPAISNYYQNNWENIIEWIEASREDFSRLVSVGQTTRTYSTVTHNSAPEDVATRLYGLTKWSNENDIDIVIHIHFNDNRRSNVSKPGDYSGFSMYVPASQYGNSTTTKAVANSILERLEKYNPVSDLPGESGGIIDEPELIAVSSNNTADSATVLIEYSYIYEPQLQNPETRSIVINDLAYQTYLGIEDFFDSNKNKDKEKLYDTLTLPYSWNTPLAYNIASESDVFAIQTALMLDGVYPPNGKSKNDCPRTGIIGDCTRTSLGVFQDKHGIDDESGVLGTKTLSILGKLQ